MAYAYNTSSAYDLEAFESQQQEPKKLRKEQLQVVTTRRQAIASRINAKSISIFLITVTVVCTMISNYVHLNEITGQINTLSSELEILQSEHVQIESKVGSSLSPRTIGERAEEMGLQRQTKSQTEYIALYHEDKIELTEEAPSMSLGEKLKINLNSVVGSIKEYIAER